MMTDECTNPRGEQTCIHRLAAGWILVTDLCPACTRLMMDALTEWVPGPRLKWHANFKERATKCPLKRD